MTAARAETPEPYQLVRALELLQDDVVKGNADSRTGQRAMLEQMGAQFLKLDPGVWKKTRNAQAAVLFVLNGGSPTVIRKVIDLKSLPDSDRDLMIGALAYVGGREPLAIERFSHIDPMKLGEALGGNVALAMGSLLIRQDPAKAIKLFSIARLLLPGTLIEEAALRRQAFIHFDQNNLEAFAKISAQYLRRFNMSVYSGQFRERLDLTIRYLAHGDDPAVIDKLGALLEHKGDPLSAELLLLFAREALMHGRIAVARAAIEKANGLSDLSTIEAERLRLYTAFAGLFSAEPDVAGKALVAAAPLATSAEDRWLVEAGARLLGQIMLWPPAVPTNPAEAGRESTGVQGEAANALLASRELLARADR
jgi:chemotaxis protein MotC